MYLYCLFRIFYITQSYSEDAKDAKSKQKKTSTVCFNHSAFYKLLQKNLIHISLSKPLYLAIFLITQEKSKTTHVNNTMKKEEFKRMLNR